jgi:hypothetical protein
MKNIQNVIPQPTKEEIHENLRGKGWYPRILACRRPGESIKAFCKRGGFAERTFYQWKKNPDDPGKCCPTRYERNLGVNLGWFMLGMPQFAPRHDAVSKDVE